MTTAVMRGHEPLSREAIAAAHLCPGADCQTLCSPGHIACKKHWKAIPQHMRDPLIAAFRGRQSNPALFHDAVVMAKHLVLIFSRGDYD